MPKPVATPPPDPGRNVPISTDPGKPKCWSFSFRYWVQTEIFPLPTRPGWFASVFNRLHELGAIPIEEFKGNPKTQAWHRYHAIDWTARNIPIQRREMTWIHSDYRDNEEEFPLMQFHISKAVGRVIGFWDEYDVFNIIALDSLHNLQPSKDYGYAVREGTPLRCDYTSLLHDLEVAKDQPCQIADCSLRLAVHKLPSDDHKHEVLILRLDNGTVEMVRTLQARGCTITDIFESGVLFKHEELDSQK